MNSESEFKLPAETAPHALSFLADSIEFAHKIAPSKWGLTPRTVEGMMRLNVVFPEVLTIDEELVRVFVNAAVASELELVKDGTLELIPGKDGKDVYATAPGSRLIELEHNEHLESYLEQIKQAHFANTEAAGRKGGFNVGVKTGHRDWAIKELSEATGRQLPLPTYSAVFKKAISSIPLEKEYESTRLEGTKVETFSTRYERDDRNREEAIKIHGVVCMGCSFDFEKIYGERGEGFIHVHHNKPLHLADGPRRPDPELDFEVLCPNCHAMVHRKRSETLSLAELRTLILENIQAQLREA